MAGIVFCNNNFCGFCHDQYFSCIQFHYLMDTLCLALWCWLKVTTDWQQDHCNPLLGIILWINLVLLCNFWLSANVFAVFFTLMMKIDSVPFTVMMWFCCPVCENLNLVYRATASFVLSLCGWTGERGFSGSFRKSFLRRHSLEKLWTFSVVFSNKNQEIQWLLLVRTFKTLQITTWV